MATTITTERHGSTQNLPREARAGSSEQVSAHRPARRRLTADETRERVKAFSAEREEALVAAVREDEG